MTASMGLVAAGVALIILAGVAAAAPGRRRRLGLLACRVLWIVGATLGLIPAVRVLAGDSVPDARVAVAMPGGAWVFGLDVLSAVMLAVILIVGAAGALYGLAYMDGGAASGHEHGGAGKRASSVAHLFVAILVAGLAGVVTARAAMPFLIAWEIMALASYVVVVVEHHRAEIRRAGLLYLVTTHAGTLVLFALFAAWGAGAGDLTFASLAARAPALPAGGAVVLVLALLGFGLKAGIVPLHFWLPEAHAASPSHVSALMSGIVIKMGVYGLLRVTLMVGAPPAWWGWLLLVLGIVSGVLGVVWALAQHDLKRLLAFHSVENIGIILIGVGAGALGLAYGHPALAVLGFAGATLHTVNHALFKSLLFLGAGSAARATGTRDIDRLGGLARRMPTTAATFLVGAAAIVGLPPLNGFVSEWLIVRGLLRAGLASSAVRIAAPAAAALGLIGALALACFAKVVGVVFLGTARGPEVERARESPGGMLAPMWVLAVLCGAIGVLPVFAVAPVLRVALLATGGVAGTAPGARLVPVDPAARTLTGFALALAVVLVVAWVLWSRVRARGTAPERATWGCGYPAPSARMQYTASSFAAPILAAYRGIDGVRVVRGPLSFATHAFDPVLEGVLAPAWRRVRNMAARLRPLQPGRLSLYLLYVVAALLASLLYLMVFGRGGVS